MAENVTILSLADRERWEAELRQSGLPSQSWSYAWGLSASALDPKLAIVECKGARMVLPFFERSWNGEIDVATMSGLSGASLSSDSGAPISLWREYAMGQKWVAGYIQLAPATRLNELPPASHIVEHNAVFLFDVHDWDPTKVASRTVRRKILAAEQQGATVIDDPSILGESLQRLYSPTMRRLGAPESFSPETLCRWSQAPTSLLLGVRLGETIEAVHLAHLSDEAAEWHIAGTTESGRSLAALIYWNAPAYLRKRGIRFCNLGGGARIGDGVYELKKRLGGVPTPLQSLRQIYDEQKYEELCALAGVPAETVWFPAYRSPA
jgi:hypothetical protein